MRNWYVLHVKTGDETDVLKVIKRDWPFINALLPQRTLKERSHGVWKTVTRTIFPGYVFVETFMDAQMYYRLTDIPSVIKILGNEHGPVPVPEMEMQIVFRLGGNGDPLNISEIFVEGSNVHVVSGPLQGLEGQIIKIDARRFRAKVNISLMGEPRIVELGIKLIKKI